MFEKEAEEYIINTGVEKDNDFVVYKIKFGEKTWDLVVEPKEALSCSDWMKMYEGSEEACHKFVDWQKGAEFGYNKANEWHFVKDGDYPKEYEDILICFLTEDDMKDCVRGWYEYDFENDKHIFKYLNVLGTQYLKTVIAWKENVLPELKESE